MEHIPQGTLERFVEGKATRRENREVVMHLLRGCDSCAAMAAKAYRPAVSEQSYNEVFDRVSRRFVEQWGSITLPALRGASACSPW
jgi:hypothetical protein